MKKVVSLLMICLLVSVFCLGSDALAGKKKLTKAQLVGTEWEIEGTGKYYDCESGDYLGSMVGAVGLAVFEELDAVGTIAPMVVTFPGVIVGASGTFILDDYTLKANILRSTNGSIEITSPAPGADPGDIEDYSGAMESVLKFTKKGTFTGTVKYTNLDKDPCEANVIKFSGKMLDKFPPDE